MKNLGIRQTPLETATAGLDERSYFGGCSLGERSQSLMCEPVSARLLGFSLAEQPTFALLGAARFRSTNRRRNGFHRVAPAALEDAVLESSHAGVYTLQIHAFPTRRAARTFGWQQLR
jgi:hypothetical protein